MPAPSLNPILAAAKSASQANAMAGSGIINLRNAQSESEQASADLQTNIGLNNQIISDVEAGSAMSVIAAKKKVGAAFGADMSEVGEVLSAATKQFHEAYATRVAALERIKQKQSVGIMDDPTEYIVNLFTINDDIKEHNIAEEQEKAASEYISSVNSLSNAAAKNQDNFAIGVTQASAKAKSDNILNAAALLAGQNQRQALGYKVEALQQALNTSKENLAIESNVYNAKTQAAHLELALKNYELHRQQFDWAKQEFMWKKEAKEDEQLANTTLISQIQKGLMVLYNDKAPDLINNSKAGKEWLAKLKMGGAVGEEARSAYMAGQSGVIAGQPAGVVELLVKGVPIQFTPAQEKVKELITSTYQKVIQSPDWNGTKDPASRQEMLNSAINKAFAEKQSAASDLSATNPYNVPPIKNFVDVAAAKKDRFVQNIVKPVLDAGGTLDTPDQIWALGINSIKNKETTPQEMAAGLQALYGVAVKANNAVLDLQKFGITPIQVYNTEITTDSKALFSGKQKINLLDTATTTAAIMKTLSRDRMMALDLR